MINSFIKQINQQTKRIKTTFYKLAFETWSWSQMQSTSRYRELIVMDAVHNKQPKKLQQSRQFILCMISRFVLEFMMLQAVLHEFFSYQFRKRHTLFSYALYQCNSSVNMCMRQTTKNHKQLFFEAFVRVIKMIFYQIALKIIFFVMDTSVIDFIFNLYHLESFYSQEKIRVACKCTVFQYYKSFIFFE